LSARRRLERKTEDRRPVVADDFIYDDPLTPGQNETADEPVSDTPEEAVRKLRRKRPESLPEDISSEVPSGDSDSGDGASSEQGKVYSSGIMLDENLQPIHESGKKTRRAHPVIRGFILVTVTLALILAVASYVFHRISPSTPGLDLPENAIGSVVTPVQDFFSGLTEAVFDTLDP